MTFGINPESHCQSQHDNSFYLQTKMVLDDMVLHMDRLESEPGCEDSARMLLRAWRTLEKGGAMFGYELVSQMAKSVGQALDFHLSGYASLDHEAIRFSRKVRLRVLSILR